MVNIKRWLTHLIIPPWKWRRAFPKSLLEEITTALQQSEYLHQGELRFAIENALPSKSVWRGGQGRERAVQLFSDLRVWDTEKNSGVLIYLLLADREVHIIADRGIAKRVEQAEWDSIAEAMKTSFQKGDYRGGSLLGIEMVTALLAKQFPPLPENLNELENQPVILTNR